jgi:predicted alpha-1,2-mannosidase
MKTGKYRKCKAIILLATFVCVVTNLQAQKLTDYVDPYIGSGGHGHVFVGANVPYGAVQVGPSNFYKGWDWCSGYNYRDSVIIGFPQLHLSGTGIGDLGDVLLMPYMGGVKLTKGVETDPYSGYSSRFSHKNEKVKPGYYAVQLDDYNIRVELTATERVGFHKYKFPEGKDARIIIDLKEGINDRSTDTYIEQVDKYTIKGYRFSSGWAKRQEVFFAIKSSVPITRFNIYDDAKPLSGKQEKGENIKALISFDQAPQEVLLKVGISPVGSDNALENIKAEIPGWDFEKTVRQADEKWNIELSKIGIETKNEVDKRIFYTAMFHLMVHPSLFNDRNGDYRGADWKVYKKAGFDNYTIFSLWDTYRAAHPLFTIIDQKRTADFVNSMLAIFEQTGILPIWHLRGYDTGTMVGINSFQIIAEAYLKGCKGFDAEKAYHALKTTAMSDVRGLDFARDFKPLPSDVMTNRPVATALEYAIGDASIARMAKAMGKTDDYDYFQKRAENYKLYFDKETGFIRGKMADGSWNPVFDPLKSKRPFAADYAEGNAWQYLWLAPQDVEGLIDLLGGKETFIDRLDTFFSLASDPKDPDVLVDLTGCIGQYAHGNEPSHHIAYLYAYAGQQWKTARLVRQIMNDFYTDQPDGIIGNEDCGQMSAWYILSSLGFYPVFTASGDYVLGSPLFDKATIHLENGKQFTIETRDNSSENVYIQSVELNGKKYDYNVIHHNDILQGGKLIIRMGNNNRSFCHPGMAQTREDMEYMKQQIIAEKQPWKTAFDNLKKQTSLDFQPQAFTHISIGPYGANSIGGREFGESAKAAYNHALMWYITENKAYAHKAIEILNAWSYQLWDFDANDAKLSVGLNGSTYLNAAEILKHTDSGWAEKDKEQFERLVLTVFYPTIKDFFTEANGNWDASMINTLLCIGIYTDNPAIFNYAVERYYRGIGNSGITKYIYPIGQCQETTRDWDHVQLGIGELAKAAQTAWTQGLDFYSVADNRLALGFEYASKFMLGEDIPVFGVLSHRRKEKFKDIYESIYDHYHSVKNTELAYTRKVIENHTRSESSTGMLTSIRALAKYPAKTPSAILSDSLAKQPARTGALDNPQVYQPGNAILVQAGESIQDAIDRNTGKTIVLGKGTHKLKESLKMKSNTTLAGQGKETLLFLDPKLSAATIVNAGNDLHDVVIRDLLIEGAVATVTNDDPNHDRRTRSYMNAPSRGGIVFSADKEKEMKNIRFENLTIQNCTKSGISLSGASNVTINFCDISDNGASVVPGAGFHHNLRLLHVSDAEIKNSRFDASPFGCGVDLSFCHNIEVSNNEAARNKLSGIHCTESENIKITHNLTEGNDESGIAFNAQMNGSRKIIVRDNLSQNNGQYGIFIEKVSDADVEKNKTFANTENFRKEPE